MPEAMRHAIVVFDLDGTPGDPLESIGRAIDLASRAAAAPGKLPGMLS